MPAYNDKFELNVDEMDLIEDALRQQIKVVADARQEAASLDHERQLRSMKDLLGRLHNQKVFFRPKYGYIGG